MRRETGDGVATGDGRNGQRRHRHERLADQPESDPAGRQDPQARAPVQQPPDQSGTAVDHVLSRISAQQPALVGEDVGQDVVGVALVRRPAYPEYRRHRLGDPTRVVNRGQVDEPGPVTGAPGGPRRSPAGSCRSRPVRSR